MDKLYEARYEVFDGKHTYLMTDRYRAKTWEEALDQFAEEATECYDVCEGFTLSDPYLHWELDDGRTFRLIGLERIPDVTRLVRACQLAAGYIESLSVRPMWERDDRFRVLTTLGEALP